MELGKKIEEELEAALAILAELERSNFKLFLASYRSLPFYIYEKIELLSTSKSVTYKTLCKKSKYISNAFHKSIK